MEIDRNNLEAQSPRCVLDSDTQVDFAIGLSIQWIH